jgi:large subunit ribosomal protein L5
MVRNQGYVRFVARCWRNNMGEKRLYKIYKEEIAPKLVKKMKYKNINEVPKLEKIVINVGLGRSIQDPKIIDEAVYVLRTVTGQSPIITHAKKSISNFKLRKGAKIGCKVTLRKDRMYEFYDRFVNLAVPRIRDFRGLKTTSFDGRGNYTIGVKEQLIFPEIDYDKVKNVIGMDITFVTTAKTDEKAKEFLKEFFMPFRKGE